MTITDIVNKIYFLTKTNTAQFTAADMLIAINNAVERVANKISQTDGRWQWNDNNGSDPFALYTVTSGTQAYAIATSIRALFRVELKDSAGNWTKLIPIDQSDIPESLTQLSSVTGIPRFYDKSGANIYLYPPPNYTQASSLKMYFVQTPSLFTSAEVTTGTKVPGFDANYHHLVCILASLDYAVANGLENANQLMLQAEQEFQSLQEDYSMRGRDEPKQILTIRRSSR